MNAHPPPARHVAVLILLCFGCSNPGEPGRQPDRPHPEIARALSQDKADWSALHVAVLEGDLPLVERLVRDGADPLAKNPGTAWTPLHVAALYDKEKILEYLVTHVKATGGIPELDKLLFTAVIHGNRHCVAWLLEQGADPDMRSHDFVPQLRVAATHDHQETLELLLEAGADVHATTASGLTALHGAAERGARGVRLLLDHGADANAVAVNGYTPLHVAAESGHANAAALLLKRGARPDARTKSGRTARDLARRNAHSAAVALLNDKD